MTTPPIQPNDYSQPPMPPVQAVAPEMAPMGLSAPMGLLAPRPEPRKPSVLFPYLMLPMAWGALFIVQILAILIAVFTAIPNLTSMPPESVEAAIKNYIMTPRVFLSLTLIAFIPLPALPMLLSLKTPEGFRRRLAFNKPLVGFPTILVLSLGAFSGGVIMSWLIELTGWSAEDTQLLGEIFSNGDGIDFVLAILGIGIVGPFAEEVVFRGFIQPRLVARHGPWPGIWITSALFAIWHMYPAHVVTVFPIGLMFGWAAWKTNSIWTGVFAHMLNNSIAVVLGFYVTDEHTGKVLTYVLLPLSAIVLAFSILLLVKMKKPPKQDEFIGFPVQ